MPRAYTAEAANEFINIYPDLRIKGNTALTLSSYLNNHVPAWGVIVTPTLNGMLRDTLVWYDAANRLHVIDVTGESIADKVPMPAYHTDDESFLYNLSKNAAAALPDMAELLTFRNLMVAGVVLGIFTNVRGLFGGK